MLRFYHPDTDPERMTALVALCHPDRKPRVPFWWQLHPTLVFDDPEHGLLGYAQFSIGRTTLFQYDMGVRPAQRRQGLGRRLFAERLRLGFLMECDRAEGMTDPDNEAMRLLFAQAGFKAVERIPGAYTDREPIRDGVLYTSTDFTWQWARGVVNGSLGVTV